MTRRRCGEDKFPGINFLIDRQQSAEFPDVSETPTAHYVPQAGDDGTIADGWLSDQIARISDIPSTLPPSGPAGGVLSGFYPNPGFAADMAYQSELDAHTGLTTSAHGGIVASTDPRLSDARTPTAHHSTHQHGGSDEVATAAPAANAIPKAGAGGTLADAWQSANIARLNAAQNWTAAQQFSENIRADKIARFMMVSGTNGYGLRYWDGTNDYAGLQTLNTGGVTYMFFGNNRYYDGSTWQSFNARAGGLTYMQDGQFSYYAFAASSNTPLLRFSIDASGTTTAYGGLNVGTASGAATGQLKVFGYDTNFQAAIFSNSYTGGTYISLANTGAGGRDYWIGSTANSSGFGGGRFVIYDNNASLGRMVIDSTGKIGLNTNSPIGSFEYKGSYGHAIYVEFDALAGVEVTLCPAGTFVYVLQYTFACRSSSGGTAGGSFALGVPGSSFNSGNLQSDASGTFQIRAYSDGSIRVVRSTGTATARGCIWLNGV